jgi:hypothetical protein
VRYSPGVPTRIGLPRLTPGRRAQSFRWAEARAEHRSLIERRNAQRPADSIPWQASDLKKSAGHRSRSVGTQWFWVESAGTRQARRAMGRTRSGSSACVLEGQATPMTMPRRPRSWTGRRRATQDRSSGKHAVPFQTAPLRQQQQRGACATLAAAAHSRLTMRVICNAVSGTHVLRLRGSATDADDRSTRFDA